MAKGTTLAMIVGGVVLYGVAAAAEAQREAEHPVPPNKSRFSTNPVESVGALAGALLATYGLSRIKPVYAVYGLGAYLASEWYVVPKLKAA
jgi:hypothetical protein